MRANDHGERTCDATSLVAALGLAVDARGVDGEDLGWVEGYFSPRVGGDVAPGVPVGVLSLVLSTLMELAIVAALPEGARVGTARTLTTSSEGLVSASERYAVRAEVVALSPRGATVEASVTDEGGRVRARAEAAYRVERA